VNLTEDCIKFALTAAPFEVECRGEIFAVPNDPGDWVTAEMMVASRGQVAGVCATEKTDAGVGRKEDEFVCAMWRP